jgi:PTH1 family peptidyl-tRNA hydrolase
VKLIVGLGNPGKKYQRTRHNLGFLVVDNLAKNQEIALKKKLGDCLIGEVCSDGEKWILAKPQTFMNRSGAAVNEILENYHCTAEDLVVIYDDLDLPFGRLRIRPRGSAGGHRGVASIMESLAGAPFYRIRVGIGRPPGGMDAADFVLDPFAVDELKELPKIIDRATDSLLCLLRQGPQKAMELYNRV